MARLAEEGFGVVLCWWRRASELASCQDMFDIAYNRIFSRKHASNSLVAALPDTYTCSRAPYNVLPLRLTFVLQMNIDPR